MVLASFGRRPHARFVPVVESSIIRTFAVSQSCEGLQVCDVTKVEIAIAWYVGIEKLPRERVGSNCYEYISALVDRGPTSVTHVPAMSTRSANRTSTIHHGNDCLRNHSPFQ